MSIDRTVRAGNDRAGVVHCIASRAPIGPSPAAVFGRSAVRHAVRGMTIIELAMVLGGAALLTLGGAALLQSQQIKEQDDQMQRWLADVELGLWQYIQRYHRLPCVDANGDGLEDRSSGACAASANAAGLPIRTLGVAPLPVGTDLRVRYGVWRQATSDLTREATPSITDALHDPDGSADFLRRAHAAASEPTPLDQPQAAGMDANGPRADCAQSDVYPAAIVEVRRISAANAAASELCFSQATSAAVMAIGRYELLGRLYGARNP